MKCSKVLAIVSLFVLLTPVVAQIRIVKANVPFDFAVGNQTLPAGEYSFELNGAGMLRIAQINGPVIVGVDVLPVAGSDSAEPRLLFHRYGNRNFLAEAWVGETGVSHRLYASAAELEYAKAMKQGTATILAAEK